MAIQIIPVLYTLFIVIYGSVINKSRPSECKRYLIISSAVLLFVSTFRAWSYCGFDTFRYVQMYVENMSVSYHDIIFSLERDKFYHVFTKFLSHIFGGNPYLFLGFYALVFLGSASYLIYKESKNVFISMVIFITLGFFFFSMNGLRQCVAMSFILMSYFPLKERRFVKFAIYIFLGSLFHGACLIFLLAYFATAFKLNWRMVAIYIVVLALFTYFGKDILGTFIEEASQYDVRYESYKTYESHANWSGFIQQVLLLGLSLVYYKRATAKYPEAQLLYTLIFLSIIFQGMAVFVAEMFRVAMFFNIFFILLLPMVYDVLPKNNRQIILFLFVLFLTAYYLFNASGGVMPFIFHWNENVQL